MKPTAEAVKNAITKITTATPLLEAASGVNSAGDQFERLATIEFRRLFDLQHPDLILNAQEVEQAKDLILEERVDIAHQRQYSQRLDESTELAECKALLTAPDAQVDLSPIFLAPHAESSQTPLSARVEAVGSDGSSLSSVLEVQL